MSQAATTRSLKLYLLTETEHYSLFQLSHFSLLNFSLLRLITETAYYLFPFGRSGLHSTSATK